MVSSSEKGGVILKFKKKDLPKQYNVWAKDQKSDDVIERSGDFGFVTFADACNWAFKEVPPLNQKDKPQILKSLQYQYY